MRLSWETLLYNVMNKIFTVEIVMSSLELFLIPQYEQISVQ